jgi:hypothetical protein
MEGRLGQPRAAFVVLENRRMKRKLMPVRDGPSLEKEDVSIEGDAAAI